MRGRHTIATGFEIVRRQINGFESSSHRGGFSFRSDFGRDAITNLRMGTASEFFGSVGEIHRGFRGWDVQTYVGDDWRATNDLTLNLGLRFTPIASPSEVNDLNKIPFDCDCNNLAPRFGFAYRLKDGWGVGPRCVWYSLRRDLPGDIRAGALQSAAEPPRRGSRSRTY